MGKMKQILMNLEEQLSELSSNQIFYINEDFADMLIPLAVKYKVNYKLTYNLPSNALAAIVNENKLKFNQEEIIYG